MSHPDWRKKFQSTRPPRPRPRPHVQLMPMPRLAYEDRAQRRIPPAPWTKLRSTLSSSNGRSRNWASEEWPVPKSSIDRPKCFSAGGSRTSSATPASRLHQAAFRDFQHKVVERNGGSRWLRVAMKSGKSSDWQISMETLTEACKFEACVPASWLTRARLGQHRASQVIDQSMLFCHTDELGPGNTRPAADVASAPGPPCRRLRQSRPRSWADSD